MIRAITGVPSGIITDHSGFIRMTNQHIRQERQERRETRETRDNTISNIKRLLVRQKRAERED